MNDWTQIDETHWETTDAILLYSQTKILIVNARGHATGFVILLPDKPTIGIFIWQMEPIYDEKYRLLCHQFEYRGITYTVHKEAKRNERKDK